MLRKNFHCHVGVVQRSNKQTAFSFAAYAACTQFNDGYRRGDYGRDAGSHVGTVMLLPPEAPAELRMKGCF
jgi:hypothetical protein